MNFPSSKSASQLKIWLINPYGPLPSEGWRDYSFVTFGKTLAACGHDVTWWTSSFSHHFKRQRCDDWQDETICDGFCVRLVPSPRYKRNIGLGRFLRDAVFAYRTWRRGKDCSPPDLILYAENPLTMGFPGYALGKHHKCSIVYDQMDLWPEFIVNAAPPLLQPLVNILFWPVYARRRMIFRWLDGVIALAKPYLDSVLREIPPDSLPPHLIIYNGIDVPGFRRAMKEPLPPQLAAQLTGSNIKAVFAGSLGPSYDILSLIDVAARLEQEGAPLDIYIAGDGPLRPEVEQAAAKLSNLTYFGALPPSQLPGIYAAADIGLNCYTSKSNVEMPDKFYDYSAAGLAIVNSLNGEVSNHISSVGAGLQYDAGDTNSLYNALRDLASDPQLLKSAKAASREVGKQFDSTAQHSALASFLEEIVRFKRSRSG